MRALGLEDDGSPAEEYTPAERREQRDGPAGAGCWSRAEMLLAIPSAMASATRTKTAAKSGVVSMWDDDEPEASDWPEELRGPHGDYDRTDFDGTGHRYAELPHFRVAWLVGLCRTAGIGVVWDGVKPTLHLGPHKQADIPAFLALLKRYRQIVVDHLSKGGLFDDRQWQIDLVFRDAAPWGVWGYASEDGAGHEKGGKLLQHDVPGYIDRITVWRRGAWRFLPQTHGAVWVTLPKTRGRKEKAK